MHRNSSKWNVPNCCDCWFGIKVFIPTVGCFFMCFFVQPIVWQNGALNFWNNIYLFAILSSLYDVYAFLCVHKSGFYSLCFFFTRSLLTNNNTMTNALVESNDDSIGKYWFSVDWLNLCSTDRFHFMIIEIVFFSFVVISMFTTGFLFLYVSSSVVFLFSFLYSQTRIKLKRKTFEVMAQFPGGKTKAYRVSSFISVNNPDTDTYTQIHRPCQNFSPFLYVLWLKRALTHRLENCMLVNL